MAVTHAISENDCRQTSEYGCVSFSGLLDASQGDLAG